MVARRGNKQYISSWKELNEYMLKHKMINLVEYSRNMCAVCSFVFLPKWIKELIYNNILRK